MEEEVLVCDFIQPRKCIAPLINLVRGLREGNDHTMVCIFAVGFSMWLPQVHVQIFFSFIISIIWGLVFQRAVCTTCEAFGTDHVVLVMLFCLPCDMSYLPCQQFSAPPSSAHRASFSFSLTFAGIIASPNS